MLKKLLKYDFKSVLPFNLILCGGTVALTILSLTFYLFFDKETAFMLSSLTGTMPISYVSFVSMIFCLVVFYKNMFKDEGYLTHTLPVTANQLLISKYIVYFVISTGISIITFFCVILFTLPPASTLSELNSSFNSLWVFQIPKDAYGYVAMFIANILVSLVFSVVFYIWLLAFISRRKHPVLTVIMIFLLGTFAIFALIIFAVVFVTMRTVPLEQIITGMLISALVLQTAVCIILHFWAKNIIEKKLNLK